MLSSQALAVSAVPTSNKTRMETVFLSLATSAVLHALDLTQINALAAETLLPQSTESASARMDSLWTATVSVSLVTISV